jgi:hypothetical protein
LSTLTDDDLVSLEARINNRPRTILDYASAQEVFSQLKNDAASGNALQAWIRPHPIVFGRHRR